MSNELAKIQAAVKAPKGQFNQFGKYKYRSCEDIVEAVKPIINQMGFYLVITDEIVNIGNRFYVKAMAVLSNGEVYFQATAFAREEEIKKGMDGAQITGAASSYARKYALNGLFAIDDTKDADNTNKHDEKEPDFSDVPDEGERQLLRQLAYDSDLNAEEMEQAMTAIDLCTNFKTYEKIQHRLEVRAKDISQIQNPSQKDISKHLKKSVQ